MIYELAFLPSAKKEWDKLAPAIKIQFKNKLLERLQNPEVPKDKLSGMPWCYKIKLRSSGYRLVYRVIKAEIVVEVVAVGARSKDKVL
jgi:mRNA interferase RelE/StbE